MSEEMLTTAELADIKARLGMRQWSTGGECTWDRSKPPPSASWLACVTLDDVARVIAEVERLQTVVAQLHKERDEALVLVAHLVGRIRCGEAAEWLGVATRTVLTMERAGGELGQTLVLASQNKKRKKEGRQL